MLPATRGRAHALANPYQLPDSALGIDEPDQLRTKRTRCDAEGQPPAPRTL